MAFDSESGDVYLATGSYIVRLDNQGVLHVLVEDENSRESRETGEDRPTPEYQDVEVVGEGAAAFGGFYAVALNERIGDLFFFDGRRIFRLGRDLKAHAIAGTGTGVPIPDDGDVSFAPDADSGSLYFVSDDRVFRIDASGMATVVAGSGEYNDAATPDGPALEVALASPLLIIGPNEKLYIMNEYPPQVQVLER
ncbi:MAG: hypothetical protein ACRDZ7_04505 [Acidimicrobiia bacterium]